MTVGTLTMLTAELSNVLAVVGTSSHVAVCVCCEVVVVVMKQHLHFFSSLVGLLSGMKTGAVVVTGVLFCLALSSSLIH